MAFRGIGLNDAQGSYRALRGGHGRRHSRCRFRFLQKSILGTANSEYWHCLGFWSFLPEIPPRSVNERQTRQTYQNIRGDDPVESRRNPLGLMAHHRSGAGPFPSKTTQYPILSCGRRRLFRSEGSEETDFAKHAVVRGLSCKRECVTRSK